MSKIDHLIKYFQPENYNLVLDIDRTERIFSGTVKIRGKQIGDTVRLHAKELEISSAKVNGEPAEFNLDRQDELEILSKNTGDIELDVDFSGKIIDGQMHGLYPCFYEKDGKKGEILATQFESHHAREVFPCIDEPIAKATFDLTLITEPNLTALSNMPTVESKEENGKMLTKFATTPKMSTYLLAFVVGDLQKKSGKTTRGVEVNIYSSKAQPTGSLDFALDIATRAIDFYEDYFGVEYPLAKSDHVALPDFSAGAMENWGLITYREIYLLATKTTAPNHKNIIATVIAHELAHMWFGNLVTMKWWDDLWLNESFANIMEYICVDHLLPESQIWLSFEASDVSAALRRDSVAGVQAVRTKVNHPDEIATLFDSAIVYAKGARLIKMLKEYIGEESFRTGLKTYFEKFAYQNTELKDFLAVMSEASGKDLESFMKPWLEQPGYPVVEAQISDKEIRLSQHRFSSDGASDNSLWPIPLFEKEKSADSSLMTEKTMSLPVNDSQDFQLNIGDRAHFITAYDETLLNNLLKNSAKLSATDKLKLITEQYLMVKPGLVSTAKTMELADKFSDEDNFGVWDGLVGIVNDTALFVEPDSNDDANLKSWFKKLGEKHFEQLGLIPKDNEDINSSIVRRLSIGLLLRGEDQNLIDSAVEIFEKHRDNLAEISGEICDVVLAAAILQDSHNFDYLLEQYQTTSSAEIKKNLIFALTYTKDPAQIDQLLELLTQIDIIKTQDTAWWLDYLLFRPKSHEKALNWLWQNWDFIEKTFSGDMSYENFPRIAANSLKNAKEFAEFKEFFADKKSIPALKRAIEMGETQTKTRLEWIERDKADVLKMLEKLC